MKSTMKIFIALLICMFTLASFGDVMLWTIDGMSSVYTFLSPVPEDDLHNPAARVKISGGGLTSPIYLDNYWSDEDTGEWRLKGGDVGIWVDDSGSGHYGAMYQQSHVPSELAMEALSSIQKPMSYYSTPEPNSGILLLIGIGFLGLKRKPVGV